jgi:hypothetical protein
MFCHITQNWRSRSLVSPEVIVNLIANTSTDQVLRTKAALAKAAYPLQTRITDEEFTTVKIKRRKFHGDWNYSICPPK